MPNVFPVTEMTPAQIAVELREIIRGAFLHHQDHHSTQGDIAEIEVNLRRAVDEINIALGALEVISRQRRPRETRLKIGHIRETCLRDLHHHINGIRLIQVQPPNPYDFSRAYALVQALPTIDHPPLGREENVIRAITAILKVYWGLKLEDTGKDLPDLIGELLEQVKNHATNGQPIQAVPTPDVDDEIDGDLDLADFDDDE